MMEGTIKEQYGEKFYDVEIGRVVKYIQTPFNVGYHYYIHKWIVKNVNGKKSVLDVGCGTGVLSYLLKKKGLDVTGVDISGVSVEFCKKHIKDCNFIKSKAENLPFDDDSFDVVTSNQLLEHIPNHKDVLKEMIRVLKPNGLLIVTVPISNALDVAGRDVGHVHQFDFYDMLHLFKEYGSDFKIYWLNKWLQYNEKTGEPSKKNIFGVIFKNDRK